MSGVQTQFIESREAQALRRGFATLGPRKVFCLRAGKVPYTGVGKKLSGSYSDPGLPDKLWKLDEALEQVGQNSIDGVGIVFYPGCGIVGLDLDHCIVDGTLAPNRDQLAALKAFHEAGCYVEASMSRTGLHAFTMGEARTLKANGVIELFGDRNFIALTGINGRGVVA